MKLENTELYFDRAKKIMPGGVSSPVRSMNATGGIPLYIKNSSGVTFNDIDDNTYYDLCMSFGPLILGHSHPRIVDTIQKVAIDGTSFGTCTTYEVELAEKIIEQHPSTDWIRFVNSGTEAVMSAIRLARGYTSRDLILKFAGCYHGHADSMLVKSGSGLVTFGLSSSAGVPEDTSKNTIILKLGDHEALKKAFEIFGDRIAAIIIEGIPANNGLLIQSSEFMHLIQTLAKKNGALFILDEVITGFRIGSGGAAAYYNIQPDIVTFGKIIGGGLPVGAYGGRKELMDTIAPLGPVYQAGTLSGNPLAMAAGNEVLSILSEKNAYEILENNGALFENMMIEEFDKNSKPLSIRRVGSIIWIIMEEDAKPTQPNMISDNAVIKYNQFHNLSLENGVYLPPSAFEVAFLSLSHNEHSISNIIDKMSKAGEGL